MRRIDGRFKQEFLEGTSEKLRFHVFLFLFLN